MRVQGREQSKRIAFSSLLKYTFLSVYLCSSVRINNHVNEFCRNKGEASYFLFLAERIERS
ncbi:hypothetical protein NIES4073_04050 [Kalymmatonema gypsitolerans NIES-4073]|nr:hypothetical protein NIES4073_04050 [Scytonema sp. NIES-4073]